MFDKRTAQEIGAYVYCLIDPRSGSPFYLGKGRGNRVFAHAEDALTDSNCSDKLNVIREIKRSGLNVEYLIIRHALDDETAFAVESSLIDFSHYLGLDLSNAVLGHKSTVWGIMSAEELNRKYTAQPLNFLEAGCVIININATYQRAKGSKSIYEATKESWVISEKRIPHLRIVLSEYRGFIVEVFEVDQGGWYQKKDHNGRVRWGFNGSVASPDIRDRYLNRSIPKKRGAANPVRFRLT